MAVERETYTIDETASVLGISRTHAYRMAASGALPTVRLGSKILIPRRAIDEMLSGQHQPKEAVPTA